MLRICVEPKVWPRNFILWYFSAWTQIRLCKSEMLPTDYSADVNVGVWCKPPWTKGCLCQLFISHASAPSMINHATNWSIFCHTKMHGWLQTIKGTHLLVLIGPVPRTSAQIDKCTHGERETVFENQVQLLQYFRTHSVATLLSLTEKLIHLTNSCQPFLISVFVVIKGGTRWTLMY